MPHLELTVLSLRYSSWSMRPWLALTHAGARFETRTVALPHMQRPQNSSSDAGDPAARGTTPIDQRRALGSVHGLFPVLRVDGVPIHESLAICEYVAETFPAAGLWPADTLERARARAVCCEMVSGFTHMRSQMSSHLFARVPGFAPNAAAASDIARVFELWGECLERSGGPFLFGRFGIADAMYFPVLGRFRTYGISIPGALRAYTDALEHVPAVAALVKLARHEPRVPIYDDYIRGLGGDPDAALAA
jgi:glutathione S-transferase